MSKTTRDVRLSRLSASLLPALAVVLSAGTTHAGVIASRRGKQGRGKQGQPFPKTGIGSSPRFAAVSCGVVLRPKGTVTFFERASN